MGRKKGNTVAKADTRPFCFFCDRKFEDEQTLMQHQRAKHFRCPECDDGAIRGKCESVQGLIVHTLKIHGKALDRVPNAMPGRDNPELNVYGMEGIPLEMLRERGYACEPVPQQKDFVEPPPSNPSHVAPEPFNAASMLPLPGFTPQDSSSHGPPMTSMLGMPGLPAPPGMPATSMLGMPGLPAPPGMMAPQDKDNLPSAPLMPGLPGLPMPPGMPMPGLSAVPPFPAAASSETAAAGESDSQSRGTKRPLDEDPSAQLPPYAEEDVSVEELRAQLDQYRPSAWVRGAGS